MIPGWLTLKMVLWCLGSALTFGGTAWVYEHVKQVGVMQERAKWHQTINDRDDMIVKLNDVATGLYIDAEHKDVQIVREVVKEVETQIVDRPFKVPADCNLPGAIITKLNKLGK